MDTQFQTQTLIKMVNTQYLSICKVRLRDMYISRVWLYVLDGGYKQPRSIATVLAGKVFFTVTLAD